MKKFTQLQNDIIKLKESGERNIDVAVELKCDPAYVGRVWKAYQEQNLEVDKNFDENGQLAIKASELERKSQRSQDNLRVERKLRRENNRYINSIEIFAKELVKIFKDRKPNKTIKHETNNKDAIGIFHLTDAHFNELINIVGNKYDFQVAAKRLKKFVIEATRIFKSYKINHVLIALTGDMLNSDRRLDELLNQATNRAKAASLSAILLEQVVLDLNKNFNISIGYVVGNESRMNKEMGASDMVISDNYDVTIIEMLKLMFRGNKDIKFINTEVNECVINIMNKNILLIHGNQIRGNELTTFQKIRGKYSDKGIKIDFSLYGHLHSTLITDFYARGSSLTGANAYSDNDLQFSSKASQNLHIITNDGIHSMKIDLQNTGNINGYNIDKDLEAYNAKSAGKIIWQKPKTI